MSAKTTGNVRDLTKALSSGMIILDVDGGADIDNVIEWVAKAEFECIFYTTANHKEDHHKFRVCLPLERPVPPDEYKLAWFGLDELLGNIGDRSTRNCTHLFYVPGRYPSGENKFVHLEGAFVSPEFLIASVPEQTKINAQSKAAKPKNGMAKTHSYRTNKSQLDWSDVNCPNLHENPVVPEHAIDKYTSKGSNWYHGRFGFMCSVANRSNREGYSLSSTELLSIFNQLDAQDGGHYQSADHQQKLLRDAENAISKVGG